MELIIPGACVPKGRPRVTFQHGKAIAYTPARTRNYAKLARVVAIGQMNEDGYRKSADHYRFGLVEQRH